ncbi:uncharacterized protein LOC133838221 isoform X2 [Drosophila sulfurigaster albostrigata]|uniref:uncharacterized protein LOC133838221 isoform X2 n=1 Tax=Drosophila sulfurigaster albostrigata TaxID=89887 RepID=UPI002D21B5AB|nr:uncharacterized protein LOC133838221 isoform X2 [Drosophila sulfurigaster albostrigata]
MLRIPVATQKEAGRCIASFQQNGCALYGFFVNWLQCRVANTRTYHDDSTSFAMCARIDGKTFQKAILRGVLFWLSGSGSTLGIGPGPESRFG